MKIGIYSLWRASATVGALVLAQFPLAAVAPFALHEGYSDAFYLGAALNSRNYIEQDARQNEIVSTQFNMVVAENDMKWESISRVNGQFDFSRSDAFVNWAETRGHRIHGHVLVWHAQTPASVFQDASGADVSREVLIQRMQTHIRTVMERYRGRIQSWDVVNEAFDDSGQLRDSPWLRIIGPEFIEIAFRTAREVDPNCILVYNDYSWVINQKRAGILAMARDFINRGVPIDALGIQGHWQLGYPSLGQIDNLLTEAAATGLKVMVTELDVDVLPAAWDHVGADISVRFDLQESLNPYSNGLPRDVAQAQSQRYRDIFNLFLKHRSSLYSVSLWGVTDRDSWLNNFPMRGRTNYPLLFDRQGDPKPAFFALAQIAPSLSRPGTQSTDPYQLIPLHRFHRRDNDSHFFTMNQVEYDELTSFPPNGPWGYDGISHWVIANHTLNSIPVYRLYNRHSGSHFYTATWSEMMHVLTDPGSVFRFEGTAFFVLAGSESGASRVHRYFAPQTGSHFFTISEAEKQAIDGTVPATKLSYDGVAWYAFQ